MPASMVALSAWTTERGLGTRAHAERVRPARRVPVRAAAQVAAAPTHARRSQEGADMRTTVETGRRVRQMGLVVAGNPGYSRPTHHRACGLDSDYADPRGLAMSAH